MLPSPLERGWGLAEQERAPLGCARGPGHSRMLSTSAPLGGRGRKPSGGAFAGNDRCPSGVEGLEWLLCMTVLEGHPLPNHILFVFVVLSLFPNSRMRRCAVTERSRGGGQCHPGMNTSALSTYPPKKNKGPVSGAFAMFIPWAVNTLPLVFWNGIIPNTISKSYCDLCALNGE
jgi:hypothetical protein